MKNLLFFIPILFLFSCDTDKKLEKGFAVYDSLSGRGEENPLGFSDTIPFEAKAGNVLITQENNIRLNSIFLVNINTEKETRFTGSNSFYYSYDNANQNKLNNWNGHFLPGFTTTNGYNMVNVAHFNFTDAKQKYLFQNPVLIRNLYYPSPEMDTLNGKPVTRQFIMVTAHNEDTNKDKQIDIHDLRRLFLYTLDGNALPVFIPNNYSIQSSQYDSKNDYVYFFARLDSNNNGKIEESEENHIFWLDLNNINNNGVIYQHINS